MICINLTDENKSSIQLMNFINLTDDEVNDNDNQYQNSLEKVANVTCF